MLALHLPKILKYIKLNKFTLNKLSNISVSPEDTFKILLVRVNHSKQSYNKWQHQYNKSSNK